MSQPTITFKRGDSFFIGLQALNNNMQPVDMSSVSLSASIRTLGSELVDDLVCEWVNRSEGSYELWASGDGRTSDWPVGELKLDIQYSQVLSTGRNLVRSTKTVFINLVKDVAQGT